MSRPSRASADTAARWRTATAAVLGGAAAVVLLPDRFGVGHRFPFVDAVAFRPQAAATVAAASVFLAARRSARPLPATLGAVAAAGLAATAVARAGHRPRTPADEAAGAGDPTEITILNFNALQGSADCGELTTLIERTVPDFVVLPEAGADFRDKLMPPLEILGYRSWVSAGPGTPDGGSVTLLAAPRAGELQVNAGTQMRLAHLEATGGLLGARTLYAVHTMAPVGRWRTAQWQRDLAVLRGWCTAPTAPIVAGDLNATLDHGPLRAALGGCRSAAGGGRRGLVGTYPTRLPRWLGIQIDHILVPADAPTSHFEVLDLAGSDHRAVLATVRLHTARSPATAERAATSITL